MLSAVDLPRVGQCVVAEHQCELILLDRLVAEPDLPPLQQRAHSIAAQHSFWAKGVLGPRPAMLLNMFVTADMSNLSMLPPTSLLLTEVLPVGCRPASFRLGFSPTL